MLNRYKISSGLLWSTIVRHSFVLVKRLSDSIHLLQLLPPVNIEKSLNFPFEYSFFVDWPFSTASLMLEFAVVLEPKSALEFSLVNSAKVFTCIRTLTALPSSFIYTWRNLPWWIGDTPFLIPIVTSNRRHSPKIQEFGMLTYLIPKSVKSIKYVDRLWGFQSRHNLSRGQKFLGL